MADKDTPSLVSLPLEVRHAIFAYAANSNVKPRRLLRYWFEKHDAKQQVATLAAEDPAAAPQLIYNADSFDGDSEISDADDNDDDDDEQGAEEEDEDDDEDDDAGEDDQGDEAVDDSEDDDLEAIDDEDNDEDDDEDDDEVMDHSVTDQTNLLSAQSQFPATAQSQTTSAAVSAASNALSGNQTQEHDAIDDNEAPEDQQDETAGNESEQVDEADANEGDNQDTAAVKPPLTYVHVHAKWRHIPSFMQLTHCPPPTELLLVSKQLNTEAKDWFYNVAVLHIEATASFAHTSFFEEAFSQITEAAFSPMENIRKVHVAFVWDSTWIRNDDTGCVEAIFPALLRQRTEFIIKILQQAPNLRNVMIHWHDSAQDAEATNLRVEIYERFLELPANVEFKEHFIAHDEKPHRKSVAGRRRIEFQNIVDNGLDRLF
ncbi:hypothetical protein NX059_011480 [Plenodomus lindquistii]|nr:hypothetical protein NX059_011480 [Plenodomus lindquistii]